MEIYLKVVLIATTCFLGLVIIIAVAAFGIAMFIRLMANNSNNIENDGRENLNCIPLKILQQKMYRREVAGTHPVEGDD